MNILCTVETESQPFFILWVVLLWSHNHKKYIFIFLLASEIWGPPPSPPHGYATGTIFRTRTQFSLSTFPNSCLSARGQIRWWETWDLTWTRTQRLKTWLGLELPKNDLWTSLDRGLRWALDWECGWNADPLETSTHSTNLAKLPQRASPEWSSVAVLMPSDQNHKVRSGH